MIEIGHRAPLNNKIKNVLVKGFSKDKEKIVTSGHFNIVGKMASDIVGKVTNTNNVSLFENEFKTVKGTKYSANDGSETFHQIMYPVIFIGQLFAIFPVNGIGSKFAIDLKFRMISIKILYNYTIQIAVGFMIAITLVWIFVNRIEFHKTTVIIFYGTNFVASFLFISLARRWPTLMLHWEEAENKFPKYRTVHENKRLGQHIRRVAAIFCTFALSEHLLSIASGIYKAYRCVGIADPIERYFKMSFPQLLHFTNYTTSKIVGPQVVNMYTTFTWNFMDLFIIVVSICLTGRLNQINYNIELAEWEPVPDSFWELNRHYYQSFIDLLTTVDKELEYIILLSFSNNLYFICLQLLNSLKSTDNIVHAIYFWFSLIFLIVRTFAVALYMSKIYDESRKPIRVLYHVPIKSYTKEVKRFLALVKNEKVALSGKRFFFITRQLILQIAGTIVTYELVLIQFNNNEDERVKDPCT